MRIAAPVSTSPGMDTSDNLDPLTRIHREIAALRSRCISHSAAAWALDEAAAGRPVAAETLALARYVLADAHIERGTR